VIKFLHFIKGTVLENAELEFIGRRNRIDWSFESLYIWGKNFADTSKRGLFLLQDIVEP
jgi:hypothetical protein